MTSQDFTCKDCGASGPYFEIRKCLDPRPMARMRVICQTCADKYRAQLSRSQSLEPQSSDFQTHKMFRKAGTSSRAAYSASAQARLGETHNKIWSLLRSDGPKTPDEVATHLDMVLNTARARMSEMTKAGWLYDTGEERETEAHKSAKVMAARSRDEREEAA